VLEGESDDPATLHRPGRAGLVKIFLDNPAASYVSGRLSRLSEDWWVVFIGVAVGY